MTTLHTRAKTALIASLLLLSACQESHTPAPQCNFEPPALDGANAGCLVMQDHAILMIQHQTRLWGLPGGTHETGESAQCTAHRETWEETGVEVKVGKLLRVFDNGFHLFRCQISSTTQLNQAQIQDAGEVNVTDWIESKDFDNYKWRFPKQMEWLSTVVDQQP